MTMDLNLLLALDALLTEGSVTGAASKASSSAMSRPCAAPVCNRRPRSAPGGLVPTPRAAELRDQVHELTATYGPFLPQTGHLTSPRLS